MALTTAGRDMIVQRIVADATGANQPYSNANAALGVGDSTTAFAAGQTDLQAATNKLRKAMMATFPTVATNVITFKSSFGSTDANWAWAEWAIFNNTTGGTMLSRKVEALGTKASGSTWELTATLTITVS
jgi:hypothetical protein